MNIEDHMADVIPDIVGDLQRNDVLMFEEKCAADKAAREALRVEAGDQGMNASQLLASMSGATPAEKQAQVDEQLAIERAQAEADKKAAEPAAMGDNFPAPEL